MSGSSRRREPEWIRISDIARHPALSGERKLEILAGLLHELAVAQAMVLVHGTKHGAARYAELGGLVRYDDDDEPMVPSDAFTKRRPGLGCR